MHLREFLKILGPLRDLKVIRFIRVLRAWQPLTMRGVLAILLGTILVRLFALPEYDLVADILGKSLLALTAVSALFAFLLRMYLGNRINVEARFDTQDPISHKPILSSLLLQGSSVPSYFSIRLKRVFQRPGAADSTHRIQGKAPEEAPRYLMDEVTFPHRGFWELSHIEASLEDALGLTRFSWTIPIHGGVEVKAPTIEVLPLPIVASSARAGDQVTQSRERAGDLFDIKQYDPSDGIKRILWKTYAKSGQLVVRRPEPAVIPEGEVALYLVAGAEDDHVAGALQGYVQQLVEHQIAILFGTAGDENSPLVATSSTSEKAVLTDLTEIQRAINRNVWSNISEAGQSFSNFLTSLSNSGRAVHHVVVFGPANGQWFEQIGSVASRSGVKLSVALVPEELSTEVAKKEFEKKQKLATMPRYWRKLPHSLQWLAALCFPSLRMLLVGKREKDARQHQTLSQSIQQSGAEEILVESAHSLL